MSYIGGTLHAPHNLSLETFKERFELIVQAILEVDEACAIGAGTKILGGPATLRIKSAELDGAAIEALERGLKEFYPLIVVEAVGTDKVALRPDFNNRLDEALTARKEAEEEAVKLKKKREDAAAEQLRLERMSSDELRAEGHYERGQSSQGRRMDAGSGARLRDRTGLLVITRVTARTDAPERARVSAGPFHFKHKFYNTISCG